MENRTDRTDKIKVGASLGTLVKSPDLKQVFMFSAITWNRHVIHYNRESARNEGLPDVVVQRALIGNFFAQFLEQWLQGRGEVERLEWKVIHSAIPGDRLTCSGVVQDISDAWQVVCQLKMVNQNGDVIANGSGTVSLYSEPENVRR